MMYGTVPPREERYANGRIYLAGDRYPMEDEGTAIELPDTKTVIETEDFSTDTNEMEA